MLHYLLVSVRNGGILQEMYCSEVALSNHVTNSKLTSHLEGSSTIAYQENTPIDVHAQMMINSK